MTAAPIDTAVAAPPPERRPRVRDYSIARIVLRWLVIGGLAVFAFWDSFLDLAETTLHSGLNGYLWTIPVAAVLAAQGVARRPRTELPIHDRQTDIILGIMGLTFAVLLKSVLMPRYAEYFHLLRLDFLALWVFVISSAIVLFGLRPVSRFAWVWVMTLMVFPLPYHLMVALLGGNRIAAGAVTLTIAGTATAIAVGRTSRRGFVGYFAAFAVGGVLLAVMAVATPYAPVIVYQTVPALVGTVSVGVLMFLVARRGAPKVPLDRAVEPMAAGQVIRSVPLVVVTAILLALFHVPGPQHPPVREFAGLQMSGLLKPPAGFHVTQTQVFPFVRRLHGRSSEMTRQWMVADVGNPEWDKDARPRTVLVDNVITDRPFTFNMYPAKILYNVTAARMSEPLPVNLGYGITGELVSVVDDRMTITWNMLQWTWRSDTLAQRVVLLSVDNHDDDAPFPQPNGTLIPTLNSLLTVLFRGNAAVRDDSPTFKDLDLLTTFGRGLVEAQLQPIGVGQ
ncbi:hypothetical protein [Mycolicibacterium phlei]|jgi:hypothetical protein